MLRCPMLMTPSVHFKAKTMAKIFREHPQRVTIETCDYKIDYDI